MLNLSNLKPRIKKRARKRVGRGLGSGHGAYSGRGIKGQKARTGGRIPAGFEGGRMPLIRQLPKRRGFKSIYERAQVVTLQELSRAFPADGQITPRALRKQGLIDNLKAAVKIVGRGPVGYQWKIQGLPLSAAAKAAVEKAGGEIIIPDGGKEQAQNEKPQP